MVEVARILGYEGSPNFLLAGNDFPHAQELGYVLRKAKDECGLQGVYVLRPEDDKVSPIPVLYVCQASTEAQAKQIHKQVWNQGIVPFVLVQTPKYLRLYSGFRYKRSTSSDTETDGILRAAVAFHEVLDQLAAFHADKIDDGTLWKEWGGHVTPETRVDWTLLKELEKLDAYLQGHGVSREISHALIGKFVYFRYLRHRDILSDRRLAKWGITPSSIYSRYATIKSFISLDQQVNIWLNGSIFPVISMCCLLFRLLFSSKWLVYLLETLQMGNSILILSLTISPLSLLKPSRLSMSNFSTCLYPIRILHEDESWARITLPYP